MSQQQSHNSSRPPSFGALQMGSTSQNAGIPVSDDDSNGSYTNSSIEDSESSYDPTTALTMEMDVAQPPASRKPKSATPDPAADQSDKKRTRVAFDARNGGVCGLAASHDRSKQLPAEIWQHIFIFLPPRSLGNLLRVNRLFHNYLDPSPVVKVPYPTSTEAPLPSRKKLSACLPDIIWQTSRRLFWPRMPSPLKGRSELDMWRLACSRSCQFCRLKEFTDNKASLPIDQWHRGPGANGVGPVFPFFVVSCGWCLVDKGLKEIDVLLSPTIPSALLPGLAAVFLTNDMHVVAPQDLQSQSSPIPEQLCKLYWKEQIDDIKTEFEAVKVLSSAAAEEWLKGLEDRGKMLRSDAARWEKWAISGGVRQMRSTYVQAQTTSGSDSPSRRGLNQRTGPAKMDATRHDTTSALAQATPTTVKQSAGPQLRPQGHQKRTAEEVAQLKQLRKAEIERRARLLDPPLTPAALAHIHSFQAALQIIAPLDDNAWELLKPRLLAQRAKAEQRERDSRVKATASSIVLNVTTEPSGSGKDQGKATDAEWDEIQGPVRTRMAEYADEIITDGWGGGKKVGKKSCTQFAVEVLTYVRKRFYAEVAKDAAAAVAAGKGPVVDPPEGPWTQKLTLENMKWVFDAKVRPHTDKFRANLFFCNGCHSRAKHYGLQPLIQHYAAKHTKALSLGNVVVHWRAEWPSIPPFDPDPKLPPAGKGKHAESRAQQQKTSSTTQPPLPANQNPHHLSIPQPAAHFAGGNSTYAQAAPVPYHPPPAASGPAVAPPVTYAASHAPQAYTPQMPYAPYAAALSYGSSYPPAAPAPDDFAGPRPPPSQEYYFAPESSAIQAPETVENYSARLDFLAEVVREAWDGISHVKDLPRAVKLCVIVHRISKAFQTRFSEAPLLDMFLYVLSRRKKMRPLRELGPLRCKVCAETATRDRKFTVLPLADHFLMTHAGLDWRTQMVLLPEMPELEKLPTILARKKSAYDMVADALPWAFGQKPQARPQVYTGDQPEGLARERTQSYEPEDAYSPEYTPVDLPYERSHTSYPPNWAIVPSDRPPYRAGMADSDRPNLKPAHEVYGRKRASAPRRPPKREYSGEDNHVGAERGRPDKAQRRTLEERPVEGLPAGRPPPARGEVRGVGEYQPQVYGGRPGEGVATERPLSVRRPVDLGVSTTRPADNGSHLLDALESHLDGNTGGVARPGPFHPARARPVAYHPDDPARYASAAGWHQGQHAPSPHHAPLREDYYYRDSRVPAERQYLPTGDVYRDAPPTGPVEKYELLEVRNPEHGTYYIRRPVRREETSYPYDIRGEDWRQQERPSFMNGDRYRTGTTVAPPSRTDVEDYDPRFPAVEGVPPQQQQQQQQRRP